MPSGQLSPPRPWPHPLLSINRGEMECIGEREPVTTAAPSGSSLGAQSHSYWEVAGTNTVLVTPDVEDYTAGQGKAHFLVFVAQGLYPSPEYTNQLSGYILKI